MRRRTFLTLSAASATAALAACAPGSGQSGSTTTSSSAAASADPDVSKLGTLTLTVWDQEVRGSQKTALDALNKAFMATYPNITIKRVSQSFDDEKKQIGLALSGTNVPDVCQVNNARADMGEFVKAGQLVDLGRWDAAYGWSKRFPSSVLAKMRYSADGVTFGDGGLYGLPMTGEVVGIYYSQKVLDKLSVKAPTSWDEFFTDLDKAKAAGLQPMALGNIEKWPALHVFGPLQAHYLGADEITKLAMGNKGGDWTSQPNKDALARFAEWGSKKYFGSSPNGLDYDTAWADFTKGRSAFLVGGSWLGTDMAKTMGTDLHFMAPPASKDGKPETTGGTGIPFAIPAKAKNADAAAAYIDFITSEDAMKTIASNGGLPVLKTASLAPSSGVNKEIFEAFDTVANQGTLLPYLDYATPTFGDVMGNALQQVIGGQMTADAAAAALQKDYAAFTA